jgi:hypothetical protein
MSLSQIIEDVRKLSPEDQQRLLAELAPSRTPLLSEAEFVARLRSLGVLTTPETRELSTGGLENFEPAPTIGKPASEIIIEERR